MKIKEVGRLPRKTKCAPSVKALGAPEEMRTEGLRCALQTFQSGLIIYKLNQVHTTINGFPVRSGIKRIAN